MLRDLVDGFSASSPDVEVSPFTNPQGYVPVNGRSNRHKHWPGVYAIGDCAAVQVDFYRSPAGENYNIASGSAEKYMEGHPKTGGGAVFSGVYVAHAIASSPLPTEKNWHHPPFVPQPGACSVGFGPGEGVGRPEIQKCYAGVREVTCSTCVGTRNSFGGRVLSM